MLNDVTKQKIKEAALKNFNQEICGVLVASGDSCDFIQCKNISSNKEKHFEISCLDYLRISENNKIVGIAHSQSSPNPSPLDVINKLGHNLYSIIYSKDTDDFVEVKEEHLKYGQYLNIPFEMGKNDCLSLVIKFYQKEYEIKIKDYFRNSSWFTETPEIIKENYKKEGFVEFNDFSKLKQGDVILCKDRHFGIYLNNDLFLHHKRDCLSNIEQFNEKWKKLADKYYRHESKL